MNTADILRDFIVDELHWDGKKEVLTPDYHLIENHVVDSLGLFNIVSFVEQHFGVMVDDTELLPENFGTIEAITSLIERKLAVV